MRWRSWAWLDRRYYWRSWFAWIPVRAALAAGTERDSYCWVWLERIERRDEECLGPNGVCRTVRFRIPGGWADDAA